MSSIKTKLKKLFDLIKIFISKYKDHKIFILFSGIFALAAFIVLCIVIGWFTTKIAKYSLQSSLPWAFIILTFLSNSFAESIMRLYNYGHKSNKKLNKHFIALLDVLKSYAVISVLIMIFEDVYPQDRDDLWLFESGTGLFIIGLGALFFTSLFTYLAASFVGSKFSADNESETELRESFQKITDTQTVKIQEQINEMSKRNTLKEEVEKMIELKLELNEKREKGSDYKKDSFEKRNKLENIRLPKSIRKPRNPRQIWSPRIENSKLEEHNND